MSSVRLSTHADDQLRKIKGVVDGWDPWDQNGSVFRRRIVEILGDTEPSSTPIAGPGQDPDEPVFTTPEGERLEGFDELLEHAFPEQHQRGMLRARPAEGQQSKRHAAEIHGISFRDLRDCFVRACVMSSGGYTCNEQLPEEERLKIGKLYDESVKGEDALLSESDVYSLPWDNMDPLAVAINLGCEVEKIMGIYPNLLDDEASNAD